MLPHPKSSRQKKATLTKINGTLLKCLAAFCVLDSVGAAKQDDWLGLVSLTLSLTVSLP